MVGPDSIASSSPLLRIPQELLLQILALLPLDDHITVIKVCSTLHNLVLYTQSIQNTRYAPRSGVQPVFGSLNPTHLRIPSFPRPKTHTILEPQRHRPFSKLICTSKGDTITRYAYRRCYDGEPQSGSICGTANFEEPPTQEEIEANRNTVTISLTMAVFRYKIIDITDCPFLDEPFIKPCDLGLLSAGSEDANFFSGGAEAKYIDVKCEVTVYRDISQDDTRDPLPWVERFKLTKATTVRQITSSLIKAAFRQLHTTGVRSNQLAENIIRFWRLNDSYKWLFSLIYFRTSPATQNMVWRLEKNPLGDYHVLMRPPSL